jgi:uncharacterized protein YcbX
MHVSALFIYPVKSLRGLAVSSAEVDALGLVGDRRVLIVDDSGQFLTQRTLPRMALIATALNADTLTLSADGHGSISVPLKSSAAAPAAEIAVSVWRHKNLLAEDGGAESAAWLSSFLGLACRLVRIGDNFRRPVLQKRAYFAAPPDAPTIEGRIVTSDLFHFADGYPFLVIGAASLADLNDRLAARGEEPVPMNRFRPNLVIAGSAPFAEDTWPRLRIGDIAFRAAGPCGRCIVTTTDQFTAERGKEPLRTLATYRRDALDPTDVNFGQNLLHETKSGTLRVGDPVTV